MVGKRHSVKRGKRFTLRAGGYHHKLFRCVILYLLNVDKNARRHFEIFKFRRHFNDVYHASAGYGDLALASVRLVDYLLNSVNVR